MRKRRKKKEGERGLKVFGRPRKPCQESCEKIIRSSRRKSADVCPSFSLICGKWGNALLYVGHECAGVVERTVIIVYVHVIIWYAIITSRL